MDDVDPLEAAATAIQTPEIKAFLDSIAGPESNGVYNRLAGQGGLFNDYTTFPHWEGTQSIIPGRLSHGAGAFQFEPDTFKAAAQRLGLPGADQATDDPHISQAPFDPLAQRMAAYDNAIQAYQSKYPGHNMLGDLRLGNVDQVFGAMRDTNQWNTANPRLYAGNLARYSQTANAGTSDAPTGQKVTMAGSPDDEGAWLSDFRNGRLPAFQQPQQDSSAPSLPANTPATVPASGMGPNGEYVLPQTVVQVRDPFWNAKDIPNPALAGIAALAARSPTNAPPVAPGYRPDGSFTDDNAGVRARAAATGAAPMPAPIAALAASPSTAPPAAGVAPPQALAGGQAAPMPSGSAQPAPIGGPAPQATAVPGGPTPMFDVPSLVQQYNDAMRYPKGQAAAAGILALIEKQVPPGGYRIMSDGSMQLAPGVAEGAGQIKAAEAAGGFPTQVALENLKSNNTLKAELAKSGMQLDANGQIVPIGGYSTVTEANARAKAKGEQGPKINDIRSGTIAATGDAIAAAPGGMMVNTGEAGETGHKLADYGTAIRTDAQAARTQNYLLDNMMTAAKGFNPGAGADETAFLKSLVNGIFPDAFSESLPAYQEFQKYAIQNARETTRSMGAGEAASVFQTNIGANPNAKLTREALMSIGGSMHALNDYKLALNDAAAQWRSDHGDSMQGFDSSPWIKSNPIVKFRLPYMTPQELVQMRQSMANGQQ